MRVMVIINVFDFSVHFSVLCVSMNSRLPTGTLATSLLTYFGMFCVFILSDYAQLLKVGGIVATCRLFIIMHDVVRFFHDGTLITILYVYDDTFDSFINSFAYCFFVVVVEERVCCR